MQRLKALEQTNPDNEMMHRALGEGHASNGNYQPAEKELRTALHLNPPDADTQYSLAVNLIALGETAEPEQDVAFAIYSASKAAFA